MQSLIKLADVPTDGAVPEEVVDPFHEEDVEAPARSSAPAARLTEHSLVDRARDVSRERRATYGSRFASFLLLSLPKVVINPIRRFRGGNFEEKVRT